MHCQSFQKYKNTFIECTFGFNLVCVFTCASYYGDEKATPYYILVNVLMFLAIIEFLIQVTYYSSVQRFCKVYKYVNKEKCFKFVKIDKMFSVRNQLKQSKMLE